MEVMDPIASGAHGADGAIPSPKISQKEMRQEGLMQLSDAEGFAQLLFHLSFLAMCAMLATWAYDHGYWAVLLAAEIPLGIGESFLFNGFHEMVHNTAFETRFLNTCFAHLLGFECFRGAKWFWCFHWTHHRFTNDPSKDPELSGESVDLDDPTKSLSGYLQFISGYPFGFERVVRMARTVCYNEVDPWVVDKPETTQRVVRMEAACYLLGYSCVFLVSLLRPSIGIKVVLLWILPHCIGAGHLRLYQFAEHRACKMGPYTDTWCFRETSFLFCVFFFPRSQRSFLEVLGGSGFSFWCQTKDTNAWICARTTSTWWLYKKLAWYMPYHVEHHAWPNVPFHKLQAAHELVKDTGSCHS